MVGTQKKRAVALILGGSSGLGLATARKLAVEGYDLCIVHRDRRNVLTAVEEEFEQLRLLGAQVLTFNVDAVNTEKQNEIAISIEAHFGKGNIKVLLHSIAKGNLKAMYAQGESVLNRSDFTLTLEAMAISLYEWTALLAKQNLFAADARVLAFTSEGSAKAWPYYAAVSAAKASLEAIIRSIALEFAPLGLKANCIQAGVTDTVSFQRIPNSQGLRSAALQRNPFGRLTTAEDVANAVYLLTLPEANWINGTVVKVDGGESLR
ncbi:MAG: SDR family oxidoreductase [Bacteroidota bacterium]